MCFFFAYVAPIFGPLSTRFPHESGPKIGPGTGEHILGNPENFFLGDPDESLRISSNFV